jgi:cytochrome c553
MSTALPHSPFACSCVVITAVFVLLVGRAYADEFDFFESKIRPILIDRCYACHSAKAEKLKGGLRLDTKEGIDRGGDNGPILVRGNPEKSRLIEAVRWGDEDTRMPPKKKLSDEQISDLVAWVKSGAPDPRVGVAAVPSTQPYDFESARKWWAFQPLNEPIVPRVKAQAWSRTAVDPFILAKMEERGLSPAAPVDKRALLRRATFDLTGLPPTEQEIESFLADESPDSFAKVVDRLLASPAYGEKIARHWLDLVRYADSFDSRGTGGAGDIREAWRYRDWVVNAFNADLPYDQFVARQIAGDLMPPEKGEDFNAEGLIATGLYAIGNWPGGDADKEKMLTDIVDDQIDVTGRAFLALTLACARCHDHKFDPIPTSDYYALAGIFFSSHILPGPGKKTEGSPVMQIPIASAQAVERRKRYEAQRAELEKNLKAAEYAPILQSLRPALAVSRVAARIPPLLATSWEPLPDPAPIREQLETLEHSAPPPLQFANGIQDGGTPNTPYAAIGDAKIHIRGRYDRLGEIVPRRFPKVIAGESQKPIDRGSGRLDLAQWVTSPKNPLTARVMVNRIWQWHFGEGLVRTPSNFGKLGVPPTHPELLDDLAGRFIQSGWSIKAMHRLIMLSATYRQSSVPTSMAMKADPGNLLFTRVSRRRLEAEELRDALLAVTNTLDVKLGGPAVNDLNIARRTLYVTTIRSDRSNFRTLFDAADPTAIIDHRIDSTVAPQALFLMNHPFLASKAAALAKLVQSQPSDDRARVDWLYRRLYARPATEAEIAIGLKVIPQSWEAYCQILLCTNEFAYVD